MCEDYLTNEKCVPKIKCNGLIYTQWSDLQPMIHGLWIEFGPFYYVCVYQQNMGSKFTGILKDCLYKGYFANYLQNWIEDHWIPWWQVAISPHKLLDKETQQLFARPPLIRTEEKELSNLLKSFIQIYTEFVKDISKIQDINYNTIEFGPALQYKKVTIFCVYILYTFGVYILYTFSTQKKLNDSYELYDDKLEAYYARIQQEVHCVTRAHMKEYCYDNSYTQIPANILDKIC